MFLFLISIEILDANSFDLANIISPEVTLIIKIIKLHEVIMNLPTCLIYAQYVNEVDPQQVVPIETL